MKKSAGKKSRRPQNSSSGKAQPRVTKDPELKQQAAVQAGMFLHTDDAWSNAYFDPNDLHNMERELFG